MSTALTTIPEPGTLTVPENPSTGALIAAVIQQGVTKENVDVVERLMLIRERDEARQAERDFNAAFVALQGEMPTIVATSEIPNRGKYERFEDVMRVVGPLLKKNGFAVSFEQTVTEDKRISVTCHLRHISGHSTRNSFTVRLGGRADSETQADCKASTTAKRNSLLQALNIVIRQDIYQSDEGDAGTQDGGEKVSDHQCAELQALFDNATIRNIEAFWAFCGVRRLCDLPASRFEDVAAQLNKSRERR